jgi:lipopolysaccharide export system protein LptC
MSLPRFAYLLLLIIAGYSCYYLYANKDPEVTQVAPDAELAAFSAKGVDHTTYNLKGIRSYLVTATDLDHYSKSGNTIFQQPVLHIFRDGSHEEWEITAEQGILDEEHVFTLYGNVLAKNKLPDAGFDTMSTDKLLIHLEDRDFWANNPVALVGPAFQINGQAMKGNFADNIATLYNDVQGRYEKLTP